MPAAASEDAAMSTQPDSVLVKRYAGSRLYDTAAARYVTIDDLRRWRGEGIPVAVIDAETGQDIGRVLLA
jgi:polyhydroxyalkanoate synthesis regulator protein